METVKIDPNFVLAAANLEMSKAHNASRELNRLMSIGYLNSQIGLDVAMDVKAHLAKAYELLDAANLPGTEMHRTLCAETMAQQDLIINRIKLSL